MIRNEKCTIHLILKLVKTWWAVDLRGHALMASVLLERPMQHRIEMGAVDV